MPHLWPWSVIYSCLMESGEVVKLGGVDDAANRRTVQLVNPALTQRKATSRTLQMSIQLVKPGERAECHRHTAAALRFVVEGDGTGYTNVEGEEMLMEPGDLVLTPNWTWHDHFNPGKITSSGWTYSTLISPAISTPAFMKVTVKVRRSRSSSATVTANSSTARSDRA